MQILRFYLVGQISRYMHMQYSVRWLHSNDASKFKCPKTYMAFTRCCGIQCFDTILDLFSKRPNSLMKLSIRRLCLRSIKVLVDNAIILRERGCILCPLLFSRRCYCYCLIGSPRLLV